MILYYYTNIRLNILMENAKRLRFFCCFKCMSCSFLGQSMFDLLCQFVVVQSPLLGELLGFLLGQVNYSTMLRLGEVGREHHAAIDGCLVFDRIYE
mgnify:CR=1 FL=1